MSRDTNRQRSNLYSALFVPALILGGLIVLAVVVVWFSSSNDPGPQADSGEMNAAVMQRFNEEYDALGVSIGEADAPVVIREFADYQCPACASFAPTAERIREELVESGDVRFVFFDFPLQMHAHAFEAAVAARCAARQDRFWAYEHQLFEQQRDWAQSSDPTSAFLDIAVETGVNAERLEQCIAQGATDDVVQRNAALAREIGVRSTPTIMVGPRVFSGAVSYDRIERAVNNQLAASSDS